MTEILISKSSVICLILVIAQQIIVASSNIWLKYLSEDLYSGNFIGTNLGLYIASLTLPYVPGGLALIALAFWEQESLKKFINRFIKNNQNQPVVWSDKNERDVQISMLTNEGQQTISSFIQYLYGLFSRILNAGLNIIVLSYIVEPNFLYGYFVSILLTAIVMRYFSDKQAKIAMQAQDARVNLGKILLSAWDNIVLGNKYNFQGWQHQFNATFSQSKSLNIRSAIYQTSISVVIAILTMLPCLLIAVHSLLLNANNKAFATTVIVTLPRLFMILNFTYDLLNSLTELPIQQSRLQGISRSMYSPREKDIKSRISWEKLNFLFHSRIVGIQTLQDLFQLIQKPGRITIRGENGTGKSTVLLLIQHELLSRSFYLPAQHHLSFNSRKTGCSTGETLKLHMQEIFNQVEADCILLDEWDANLDKSNQSEISQLIDQLAQNKTVVEVRHR